MAPCGGTTTFFRFKTSRGFPFFSIFHSNISASLGSFIIVPCIYQSFSAALGEPMRCSGFRLQPGLECVFTCCLAQLRGTCEGVWRPIGRVCDLKRLNGGGSTPLPFHPRSPHFLTKESHSLGQIGAKLVKFALPAPLSSLRVGPSLLSVWLWVFGVAQVALFYIRGIKTCVLSRPLCWENRIVPGEENEMWSWWKKWVMFWERMEEEVWCLASLCFLRITLFFFFFFFSWV